MNQIEEEEQQLNERRIQYANWIHSICTYYNGIVTKVIEQVPTANASSSSTSTVPRNTGVADASQQSANNRRLNRENVFNCYNYQTANLGKRFLAELIDQTYLWMLRMILVVAFVKFQYFDLLIFLSESYLPFDKISTEIARKYFNIAMPNDRNIYFEQFQNQTEPFYGIFLWLFQNFSLLFPKVMIIEWLTITVYIAMETLALFVKRDGDTLGGASLGKRIMGLKVIKHSYKKMHEGYAEDMVVVYNVKSLTLFRAFLRTSMKHLSLAYGFPTWMLVVFNMQRLALHDLIFSTIVVDANSEEELQLPVE